MEVFRIAKQNELLINEQIKYPMVLVIGPNGEKLGEKTINDALTLASYAGLDLVLVGNGEKPVCKIMDYNKYRYEKQKQAKETKKKQREQNLEIKEYRLSVTIDVHDFETKLRNAREYLQKGHKIKAVVRFKGRQMAHIEIGKEVLLRFIKRLEDIATIEQEAKLEGKFLFSLLAPKK